MVPRSHEKNKGVYTKNLSLVDVVFELLDARIPYSSQNPVIDSIVSNKPRVIIMNKSDLADHNANILWQNHFNKEQIPSILFDAISGKGVERLLKLAAEVTEEKRKSYESRGVINRPIRAMILGIPNVGKSTLINTLSGKKGAKTGNRPGITKSNQWIKIRGQLELLDTPGILWPKFEEEKVGLNLAFTGAIKDEILDTDTLALKLLEVLIEIAPDHLMNRYNVELDNKTALEVMELIGVRRGCIVKGGEIDYSKTSNIILDEFRKGKIGKITLELPRE